MAYRWFHDQLGGYVKIADGSVSVTFDSNDPDPVVVSESNTTNLDKATTSEISNWVHSYLLQHGWYGIDAEHPNNLFDVFKAYRDKDSDSHHYYVGSRITSGDEILDPVESYRDALSQAENRFGCTFKRMGVCRFPTGSPEQIACEEENAPPGPVGLAQYFYMGMSYDFPIIEEFTRTSTDTGLFTSNTTNGYVQFSRDGNPQLLTAYRHTEESFEGIIKYPWEEVVSSSSSRAVDEESKAGDTQLYNFHQTGNIKIGPWTSDTWTYLYPFSAFDYKHDYGGS